MRALFNQFFDFWRLFGHWWFIWVPVGLFFLCKEAWYGYAQGHYLSTLKWVLLEIKVSRDIAKSPKAMESIFAGFHGAIKGPDIVEKYWGGVVEPWFSLEIVGDETGVHFYVFTQAIYRRLVEAQIYAQYPTCEIVQADDYTKVLPQTMPDQAWNLFGTEMVLTKPDAYPIRTYEEFTLEDISSKEEERKIDPLAALVEFLGSLQFGEHCWIQFLIRPAGSGWRKEGEQLIAEMVGRASKPKPNILERMLATLSDFVNFFIPGESGSASPEKKDDSFSMFKLTSGQQEIMKAVEKNIAKIGFDVGFRWMYLARRDVFSPVGISAMLGIFKQFSSQSLNGFKMNSKTVVKSGYWKYVKLGDLVANKKRSRLFNAYRLRSFFYPPYAGKKPFVLSSSELATVYHFPGTVVGAPSMTRIEAKKGTPPPNLPM